MLAREAREISKCNAHLVARKQLNEAIEKMEKEIKKNAKEGHFQALIQVALSNQWINHHCSDAFVDYFQHKGFEVKSNVFQTFETVILSFICRW
ncbi:hypothetical protein QNH23_06265 [Siminovitchia fortis]|uniref:Uncharacterized protein n=1 Tax=Siminovitchia fortis TaxID=254758 RepID=A0A443IMT4_9BACI|nr:hypothetical protein [Siminovitchia fortis]RWR06711.1 hypothetical protein D4N35_013675 [Siminovitchia fortis]WHY82975.1 hypothetical protein QNH23_06265 [Siminovitchia fortis]